MDFGGGGEKGRLYFVLIVECTNCFNLGSIIVVEEEEEKKKKRRRCDKDLDLLWPIYRTTPLDTNTLGISSWG